MGPIDKCDSQIARYLRASAEATPGHATIGPFLARFDTTSANPYLSYAIPDDDADPTSKDVAALIAAFHSRNRKPRLEYIPAAAPKVEAALLAHGFAIEGRYPVMTSSEAGTANAAGLALMLTQDDDGFAAAAEAGRLAFGGEGIPADSLKDMVVRGALLALAKKDGRIVGTGMATAMQGGVVEIAGIGVIREFRCCGIGAAMAAFVTAEAFARGAKLAWLAPGDGAAERLYQRAGFSRRSEQLHIGLPD